MLSSISSLLNTLIALIGNTFPLAITGNEAVNSSRYHTTRISVFRNDSSTEFDTSNKINGLSNCPSVAKFGIGPPKNCSQPTDPNHMPPSELENWFTEQLFVDLFPFANLGWGPNKCWPYSYESFRIAARYFPEFGTSSPNTVYTTEENTRRDVAAFFAQTIQETGANDVSLYDRGMSTEEADNCFYRGGLYNWFEGGPTSSFLSPESPGYEPSDGNQCNFAGRYCISSPELDYWYPCNRSEKTTNNYFTDCFFGRGAFQISYNFNYGQFQEWLLSKGIMIDLLAQPNLIMTNMDPPLAMLASLWFYMTPQPPKPAMHNIILGTWNPGPVNQAAGYFGPIFGPTSLIINNECGGEDPTNPGGPDMPQKFDAMFYNLSYQPDWSSTWKKEPCKCAPATYAGMVPYYDPKYYPEAFVAMNDENRQRCVESIYDNPDMYRMSSDSSPCLKHEIIETSDTDPTDPVDQHLI
ncbi:Endochitinase 1 [Toxocara canis]|uniref:Endochitinase 1 n=1 Tax=Toxocara canis TaxID=6265 RepID=A0A0B2VMR2_TOXCA|nr:Endochitinase 1 [Toxocara canis]